MSYQTFADRLIALGNNLHKHADKLSGTAPAKAVKSMNDNAEKLEKMIEFARGIESPEGLALGELLEKHAGVVDPKTVRSLATKLGIKLSSNAKASAGETRNAFVSACVAGGLAKNAAALVEAFVSTHRSPKPDTSTAEKLRAEVRRLGALSSEAIMMELESKKYTLAQVKALAENVGLVVGKNEKKPAILPNLVHHIRRSFENTRNS